MADDLKQEIEVFTQQLPELVASGHEGKYALVVGKDLIGVYETYADALQEGYKSAGLGSFLVNKISAPGFAAHFSRFPCHDVAEHAAY